MNKAATIALSLILGLTMALGCVSKKPLPQVPPPAKAPEEKPRADLLPILMDEAQKFADQNQYQDALLIYSQALILAGPQGENPDQKRVLDAVESLLMRTPPAQIEQFQAIKNQSIPPALLRYYTGLNYAAKGETQEAARILSSFVSDFPGHAYAQDARDLLETIKKASFNRDTLGCLLPLSGKYSVFGQRALKGIQMAVQDFSLAQGRPFKVIVKDTRSDPDHAVNCVEELAREKVMAILGPLLVPEAAGKRAEALKIPLMALTQKKEFPLQGDYLFSNFITPEMQVQALGAYIFMELGLKKVAIFYPEEKYGQTYMELFWDVVDEFNGEVVGVESYDGTSTDFSLPLQKLTGEYYPVPEFLKPEARKDLLPEEGLAEEEAEMANPETRKAWTDEDPEAAPAHSGEGDRKLSSRGATVANEDRLEIDFQALFIPDALSRVNLILPQLAFHDARGMVLLGTNLWHQDSLLTQARGYNKKAVITDGYFGESQNPVTADFHRRFQEIFQETPGFLEAIAYDTVKILFTAGLPEEVASRSDVKEMLKGGQFYEGVTGRTIFDNTGSPHKELFLITVKRGKFMEIRP